MDKISDLGGINSDKPGRRYFKANGPVKPASNYNPVNEEKLVSFNCGDSVYGCSIKQVSKKELAEFVRSSKKSPIKRLLNDSGMHLVSPKEL